MRKLLFLFVSSAFLNLGCPPKPVCMPHAMRCFNNSVQLCDKNGKWRSVIDCKKVKPTKKNWKCLCKKPEICACYIGD
jgi:hypothetical protein